MSASFPAAPHSTSNVTSAPSVDFVRVNTSAAPARAFDRGLDGGGRFRQCEAAFFYGYGPVGVQCPGGRFVPQRNLVGRLAVVDALGDVERLIRARQSLRAIRNHLWKIGQEYFLLDQIAVRRH